MSKLVLSSAVVICVMVFTGCGTIRGIGEDITSLGGAFSKGSDHYKEAIGNNPPGSKMGSKTE